MNRRNFLEIGAGLALSALTPVAYADNSANVASYGTAFPTQAENPLHLRFLGTGAADWNGRDERGEERRLTSILLDKSILVDYTATATDMLQGITPHTIFYTHSHGDHYQPLAAVKLGVKTVYVHRSWWQEAVSEFQDAAKKAKMPSPKVLPLDMGKPVTVQGIQFTALPANHVTRRLQEDTLIYLIEKGTTRLLYATDTGGIMGKAARLAGIDAHVRPGKAITALIMEATMGIDYTDDFRIYCHSSVATVAQVERVLMKTKRYTPKPGQPVWLTHLARTLHDTQAELNKQLPKPLQAAWDGLEIVL